MRVVARTPPMHRAGTCLVLQGPQRCKGHFEDYEVGANCIVLLIALCLWGGAVIFQFLWRKCLLSLGATLGGVNNQDVPGVLAAKLAHSTSNPPPPTAQIPPCAVTTMRGAQVQPRGR